MPCTCSGQRLSTVLLTSQASLYSSPKNLLAFVEVCAATWALSVARASATAESTYGSNAGSFLHGMCYSNSVIDMPPREVASMVDLHRSLVRIACNTKTSQ